MATDTSGNQKVDFVWGNLPMQPDADRQTSPDFEFGTGSAQALGTESGNKYWKRRGKIASAKLDSTLDNHIIATAGYEGFPDFIQGAPYDDTTANATVPNVVGLSESAANTALVAAGLVKGAVTTANNAAGATALNDGLVKTQTPAAATVVNAGASVALVKYAYTA